MPIAAGYINVGYIIDLLSSSPLFKYVSFAYDKCSHINSEAMKLWLDNVETIKDKLLVHCVQ